MSKTETETICEELGVLPPLVKKWIQVYITHKFKPEEKPCMVEIEGVGKRRGFLSYVSSKGKIYLWINGEEKQLPKNSKCYLELEVYQIEPLEALKKELKRLNIPYKKWNCQLHGEPYLDFSINQKQYSISL